MSKVALNRQMAQSIMSTFVVTLRARQERRGDDPTGAGYYALGYLESMMADFMAENPKIMARMVERLNTLSKDLNNA